MKVVCPICGAKNISYRCDYCEELFCTDCRGWDPDGGDVCVLCVREWMESGG